MPVINNFSDVRILFLDSGSSINLGNSIQINPTNNNTELGKAESVGDHTISAKASKNLYMDPDVFGQTSKG